MSSRLDRRLLILGCGSLGAVLAAHLKGCVDLTVIDPCPRALFKGRIFSSVDDLKEHSFDGLIVATKCFDIDQALKPFKNRILVGRVLFLQNGILDLSRIPRVLPQAAIVRGVTTSAVGIVSGKAVFHYEGEFYLAPGGDESSEAVRWFGCLFRDAGLKTRMVAQASRIVWAKLIFSAVMNPLPVMTGKGYDVLKKDEGIWKLVQQAVKEGRAVARVRGVRLAFDPLKLILRVRNGDLAGIAHRGSIQPDIKAGGLTELDFITGALVRQARQLGVNTPALERILCLMRRL